jgi:SAM-dependent methyltransferase
VRDEPPAVLRFDFIDPPFHFNHPEVSKYPPEVTGQHLLRSLSRRLGWTSFAGKKLLDFGCGVRFARTILNLGIDIDLYAGVDVNRESIAWLQSNVVDARFRFDYLNMRHRNYNPDGTDVGDLDILEKIGLGGFDAACMFSVMTHQTPRDAEFILRMLHRCVVDSGFLYFTAFVDDSIDNYVERDTANPTHHSTYHPAYLIALAAGSGWTVTDVFLPSRFQQTAFLCRRPAPQSEQLPVGVRAASCLGSRDG